MQEKICSLRAWVSNNERIAPCEEDYGIREIFDGGMRNLGLWNPGYGLRNPGTNLQLESGIHVPLSEN